MFSREDFECLDLGYFEIIYMDDDNDLMWRLIQTVKVINQNKIEIQFRSGIVMVQRLDAWED